MKRTVLISGGFGYLGGRLAQFWSSDPELQLRIGSRTIERSPLPGVASQSLIRLDTTRDQDVEAACNGVNTVVHLAAANAQESVDAERALAVNGLGSLKLLRAAERAGVERFIYVSTAHVYGSPLRGSISEGTTPRPETAYAITHRVAEDFVLAAHDAGRIVGVVARLSNAVGAPADISANCWMLLTNDLCRQAVLTRTLTLRSAGDQLRDFVPMGDVVRAVAHLGAVDARIIGNGLFNLGSGQAMSVYEMTCRIASRCQKTLGFLPAIVRPQPLSPSNEDETLDYEIKKLEATDFARRGDLDAEIDATLEFAAHAFG